MKAFSMFSGCGGFDLACERQGIEIIGHSEIDKYADAVYAHHFNNRNYGDATRLLPDDLPDFNLLTAGFPCQSFSIAGKRGGFADTRGTLFFEIARVAEKKRPQYLLLENVKGLLSHDHGRTYKTILSTLIQLGYDLRAMVINSKNHGVPQNRERIFIAGCAGGWSGREVFLVGENDGKTDDLSGQHANTLTARYEGAQAVGTYVVEGEFNAQNEINQLNNPVHSNDRVYGDDGISPSLNTMQGGRRQPKILQENLSGQIFEKNEAGTIRSGASANYQVVVEPKIQQRSHGFFKGSDKDHAPSIRGASVAHNVFVDKIRRLTPVECERLQGFPDDWSKQGLFSSETKEISDSQRYKMMGNAVTVNAVEYVLERMFKW